MYRYTYTYWSRIFAIQRCFNLFHRFTEVVPFHVFFSRKFLLRVHIAEEILKFDISSTKNKGPITDYSVFIVNEVILGLTCEDESHQHLTRKC